MTRRAALFSAVALVTVATQPLRAAGPVAIQVVKGTACECCNQWVEDLRAEGFAVTEEERYGTLLMIYKSDNGIPEKLISCHTGSVEGYMLEGHVPAADIRRLLTERPDAIGLALPGMPHGSPGMEDASARAAYDVFLIRRDGPTKIFTSYEAA